MATFNGGERYFRPRQLIHTWDEAFLNKLARRLAMDSILLDPMASRTYSKRKPRAEAARRLTRALAPPHMNQAQLRQTIQHFKQLYAEKRAELGNAPMSRAPSWVRTIEPHMRALQPPPGLQGEEEPPGEWGERSAHEPTEQLLHALTERARELRTIRAEEVCQFVACAPHLRADQLRPVWELQLDTARSKLAALVAHGDTSEGLAAAARLSRGEWRLVDAVLLYEHAGAGEGGAVVRAEHVHRAEPLRALVACFHLVQLFRLEEEGVSAGAWRAAAAAYRRRGRIASAVLLQRRWHELKMLTRAALCAAARRGACGAGERVAPLLLAVARRFQQVAVAPLPSWRDLVHARRVVDECDLTALSSTVDEETKEEPATLPAEGVWGSSLEPRDSCVEAEDDLILVEQEIETIDLLAAPDHQSDEESGESTTEVVVKRELVDIEDVRAALENKRKQVAQALQHELDRQLRLLDTGENEIDEKLLMTTTVPLIRVDDSDWHDILPPPRTTPRRAKRRFCYEDDDDESEQYPQIKITSIKSEPNDEDEKEDEGSRGRKRVRLPDIAEVRRINRGMLTAQVAPLASKQGAGVGPGASRDYDVDASSRSSSEGALQIDSGEEGGEGGGGGGGEGLRPGQLHRLLQRLERVATSTGYDTGWKTRYCCVARYHRALNDARRRARARAGRPPPADTPVHTRHCPQLIRSLPCACCCRLLDGHSGDEHLTALRRTLLATARSLLEDQPSTSSPPLDTTENPEPEKTCTQIKKKVCKKRKRVQEEPPPPPSPNEDPLQEWIRQKNITSRFFDLNLKKPPPVPKPPPPEETPAPVYTKKKILNINSSVTQPSTSEVPFTIITEDNSHPTAYCNSLASSTQANTNKPTGLSVVTSGLFQKGVKNVTVSNAVPDTQPPLQLSFGPLSVPGAAPPNVMHSFRVRTVAGNIISAVSAGQTNLIPTITPTGTLASGQSNLIPTITPTGSLVPGQPNLIPTITPAGSLVPGQANLLQQPFIGGSQLPAGAIPVTMFVQNGAMQLVPVCIAPRPPVLPARPRSPDVIDLCDDSPANSPAPPSPSPPPSPPPQSSAQKIISNLPPGISVKRTEVPPEVTRAREILNNLPPGIMVKRKGDNQPLAPAKSSVPPTKAPVPRARAPVSPAKALVPPVKAPFLPAKAPVMLNKVIQPMGGTLQISPLQRRKSNVKVFKISEDGLLTPSSRDPLSVPRLKEASSLPRPEGIRAGQTPLLGSKGDSSGGSRSLLLVGGARPLAATINKQGPVSGVITSVPGAGGGPPRILNSMWRGDQLPKSMKIAEIRTADGKKMVVMRQSNTSQDTAESNAPAQTDPSDTTSGNTTSGNPTSNNPTKHKVLTLKVVSDSKNSKQLVVISPKKPRTENTKNSGPSLVRLAAGPAPAPAAGPAPGPAVPCTFELTPRETYSDVCTVQTVAGHESPPHTEEKDPLSTSPPQAGVGVAMQLQGGAVVCPAQPSHGLTDYTISYDKWYEEASQVSEVQLLQVTEQGASFYMTQGYYVRTTRVLPFSRAAVWTCGARENCSRILLHGRPRLVYTNKGSYLKMPGGLLAKAEWVCRNVGDIKREARSGGKLSVVQVRTGVAHELTSARAPRPHHLALRSRFLTAAMLITHDVNKAYPPPSALIEPLQFVKIAPKGASSADCELSPEESEQNQPEVVSPKHNSTAHMTSDKRVVGTDKQTPGEVEKIPEEVESLPQEVEQNSGDVEEMSEDVKQVKIELQLEEEIEPTTSSSGGTLAVESRASIINANNKHTTITKILPSKKNSTNKKDLATKEDESTSEGAAGTEEELPPPSPPRRSSRRAAFNARAKLNDIIKQGSGPTTTKEEEEDGNEPQDYSEAAGLDADSDDDYNMAADMARERTRRRPAGKRHRMTFHTSSKLTSDTDTDVAHSMTFDVDNLNIIASDTDTMENMTFDSKQGEEWCVGTKHENVDLLMNEDIEIDDMK